MKMKIGIKVGLKSNWYEDLIATKPSFCELWFHSGKIKEYDDLFIHAKKLGVRTGLHYWGALPDGTLSNLAYPDKEIISESRELVKRTIETAARQKSLYVNLHPAGSCLTRVDFENQYFHALTEKVPYSISEPLLQESIEILAQYAKQNGVPLTIESVPLLAGEHPFTGIESRKKTVDIGEFPIQYIEPLLQIPNVYFANDFGHSGATIITSNRTLIWDTIRNIARRLKDKTKLIHVGYLIPPYNGTDYHGTLYYPEFKTSNAVPNYTEMLELLHMFLDMDVYALVEPEKDHQGNFKTLQEMIRELT